MYKKMPKANEPDPMEQMVIAEIDEEEEKRSSNAASSLKSVTDLNWPQEGEFNLTEGEYEHESGSAVEDEDLL
jgi:hypothetical protein